jgi:hypothetical protein
MLVWLRLAVAIEGVDGVVRIVLVESVVPAVLNELRGDSVFARVSETSKEFIPGLVSQNSIVRLDVKLSANVREIEKAFQTVEMNVCGYMERIGILAIFVPLLIEGDAVVAVENSALEMSLNRTRLESAFGGVLLWISPSTVGRRFLDPQLQLAVIRPRMFIQKLFDFIGVVSPLMQLAISVVLEESLTAVPVPNGIRKIMIVYIFCLVVVDLSCSAGLPLGYMVYPDPMLVLVCLWLLGLVDRRGDHCA